MESLYTPTLPERQEISNVSDWFPGSENIVRNLQMMMKMV